MLDVPRPTDSEARFPFSSAYPRCLVMFERAVGDSLDHPSDDYCRTHALDLARALLDGCKVCGYREDTGILESVAELLVRPFDRDQSDVPDLRERFRELLGFLKSQACVRSA